MRNRILIGTSKGLVVFNVESSNYTFSQVHFVGMPVSMVYVDSRTNTWWIALSHRHWGEKLHRSTDEGKSWTECAIPSYSGYNYKSDKPASLKKIWVMTQAGYDRPGCLWLGTEPGGLFFTDDNGKSFHLNESLWNHPSRLDETQWFGAGKDYPFIHSIVINPSNHQEIYVGISCAGIFKSEDGGKTWQPKNNGLVAAYLPNPKQEIGHDPHQVLMHPRYHHMLWQQNHCGIFRTVDGGNLWTDVSGKNGIPKYGFCLAIDEENPDEAWVIPAQSDEKRIPIDLKLKVYHTKDAGLNWLEATKDFPSPSFDLVLRHAFYKKDNLMAFGTNNGNLYLSFDTGMNWNRITESLSSVNNILIL